jgi:hypothetical protein
MSNRAKWAHWRKPIPRSNQVGLALVVILGLFLAWVLLGTIRSHAKRAANACPIDGAMAQSSKRISSTSCEYFHFNAIERQMHSWVANCVE